MQQQWHLFPAVSSKCEYDETSVNKSDGNGYPLKVCSCLVSLRSLRSSLVAPYCKGSAGFCALFGKVGSRAGAMALRLGATKYSALKWTRVTRANHEIFIPCVSAAQRDLPGHRTLQDVPSHGHLETGLRLPGQHQVRALASLRLQTSRNSPAFEKNVLMDETGLLLQLLCIL